MSNHIYIKQLEKLKKNYSTNKFLSHHSFLKGMGSIVNLHGESYFSNKYLSGNVSDYEAIKNDWGVIGSDFAKVINNFEL